jgi:hypothetical protein
MTSILSGILPLVFGAIGWVVFEFLGRPVRSFFDLRRETKRQMLLHWDASLAYTIDPAELVNLRDDLKEPRAGASILLVLAIF